MMKGKVSQMEHSHRMHQKKKESTLVRWRYATYNTPVCRLYVHISLYISTVTVK